MGDLLPVDSALAMILDGAAPLRAEEVAIAEADGRVLAAAIAAARAQPPFPASAMDGYAVRGADVAAAPATLSLIGVSIAGAGFAGHVGPGEAVRIFTGAPVPAGADAVLIQEEAEAAGDRVTALAPVAAGRNIRPAGRDFSAGEALLEAGRILDPGALSLAAAAGRATVSAVRRPLVAILSTGGELVPPGAAPTPDQIFASSSYGVAAIARAAGGEILDLGIAPDSEDALRAAIGRARACRADILVTLGGASVGEHDLVAAALAAEGMEPGFWRVAMRPGKPLLFGRFPAMRVLGLPGNPVSSLVCSHLFLKPLIATLAGRPADAAMRDAVLAAPMRANDQRQDYVRAKAVVQGERLVATPFPTQDSSMLSVFAAADALIVRAPGAPAAAAGETCRVLMLR